MRLIQSLLLCVTLLHATISTTHAQNINLTQTKELKGAIGISPDFKSYIERFQTSKNTSEYGVKIRDVESGNEVRIVDWDKDWGVPYGATISPDSTKLAILSGGMQQAKTAKVFDITTGEMKLNIRHPLLEFVVFTAGSKGVASTGGPGASKPTETLWIWNIDTRNKLVMDCPTKPNSISLSPNGKLVSATHGTYASKTPLLTICEIPSGKRIATIPRSSEDDDAICVSFSTDSKLLAFGTRGGHIKLMEVATRKEIMKFDDIQDQIFSLAFHPKEKLLAATGKDKTIRFWDYGKKKLVSTTKLSKLDYYLKLHFSDDGTQLASSTQTGDTICIWKVDISK